MATTKKTTQKSIEERQRIYDATTTEERLRVVKERTTPEFSNGRKPLSIGFAFGKGTEVYKLVEEVSYYLGYPSGGELDEATNRVIFQETKEDGMIQWRAKESFVADINDVLKALLTGIFASEDPSFLSQIRQSAVTAKGVDEDTKKKVNEFFKDLDEYRRATESVREEKKLAEVFNILSGLSQEQFQKVLAAQNISGQSPAPHFTV